MDFSRLRGTVDVDRLQNCTVALIGAGGSAGLAAQLVRCGLGALQLWDFDAVSAENIARQDHHPDQIGRPKVQALADQLRRIRPEVRVLPIARDFLTFADDELDVLLEGTDLLIAAADAFAVAARINEVALRRRMPALWIGLYPGGGAGEIVFWHPDITACYRCLCEKRYRAHAEAKATGTRLDPSSDGCTILDIALLDAIAGQLAIGLLTRGSDTRYGRLIDQLGGRNFLQLQIAPDWTLNGRSPVRSYLQIPELNDGFFAWNTVVRCDPSRGQPPCPDCERFLNRSFDLTMCMH